MKLLVVGSGGREDALVRALAQSPRVSRIYALPGNAGIAENAVCVPVAAKDIEGITAFAVENGIDFAVVAPDDPLALGAVDSLTAAGIPAFGPTAGAARIEASKVFSKALMREHGIPTAESRIFDTPEAAERYLVARTSWPQVLKADGLALGKGVVIAQNLPEALDAVDMMMRQRKFGESGARLLVEEFLTGPEVSVLSFTDGETLVPMISSMDHKRAGENDTGLNTGGMGAVAPNPFYTPALAERCMREIFLPTVAAMNEAGSPFKGCLYFGLMLTPEGPKVIEYNCRFGDPEAQAVLPLLESDLLEVLLAVAEGRLKDMPVRFSQNASCCVVLASEGYPAAYKTGFPIELGGADTLPDVTVYHAGTRRDENGRLVTAGGRVLGVTAVAPDAAEARRRAYEAAARIRFEGVYCRRDIGGKH